MSLRKERATVTPIGIATWFNDLQRHLNSIDPTLLSDPLCIYNVVKSGFSFDIKSLKVVAFRGSKYTYNVTASTKTQVTVMACMSAGGITSPYFSYTPTKGSLTTTSWTSSQMP